jgi:hypothetical protein
MMIPTFTAIAEQNDLTLSVAVRGGCPWQEGLSVPPLEVFGTAITPQDCVEERADVYDRVVDELDPDVIVVMNLGYESPNQSIPYRGEDNVVVPPDSPAFDALLEDATRTSLDQLRASGRKVVVIEPIPLATSPHNPLICLSQATVVEECRFVARGETTGLEVLYRRLADADEQVWTLDMDRLVCPYLPICDPIVDGEVTRIDGSHLTGAYARTIAPAVARYLTDNGVLSA